MRGNQIRRNKVERMCDCPVELVLREVQSRCLLVVVQTASLLMFMRRSFTAKAVHTTDCHGRIR